MTTETTRTLEEIKAESKLGYEPTRLIEEAYRLGAAPRASPEERCPCVAQEQRDPECPLHGKGRRRTEVEESFILDAVSQALDGKELSDFALSFPVVAAAADLHSRLASAECMRDDRIACVNMLEKEIEFLRRASPEEGRALRPEELRGMEWNGRTHTGTQVYRCPYCREAKPDHAENCALASALRSPPAPTETRSAPTPEESGAREPGDET